MQLESTAVDVGARVHSIREARGISVRTLAARAGFSPSFVSQVENGQASPSIASLHKIADALGISLADFFAGGTQRSSALVRASNRPPLESDWSNATLEDLRGNATGNIHPTIITLDSRGASGKSQLAVD
ncbi:MAG: helix-turn-helix domain-containing protein, partial [Bryobacterales bacterium]|nr:helix-turn-helix domain-containing protein [Bryobacterales bacterium]